MRDLTVQHLETPTAVDSMEVSRLVALKEAVENLDRVSQARALSVLMAHDVPYDENDNGVFVNMSVASPTAVVELEKYVEYVRLQHAFLAERESERDNLLDNYFKGGDNAHDAPCSGSSTDASSPAR